MGLTLEKSYKTSNLDRGSFFISGLSGSLFFDARGSQPAIKLSDHIFWT
jgi:hypothetical protein